MNHNEMTARANDLNHQLDYALTSLCFAALALSYQFSPNPEHKIFPDLLVVAWICFLVASYLGARRLIYAPVFLQMNAMYNKVDSAIKERQAKLLDPRHKALLARGDVRYSNDLTGGQVTEEMIRADIERDIEAQKTLQQKMNALGEHFPKLLKWQLRVLIAGLTLNTAFATFNYCSQVGCLSWLKCH
jgi:hypothetical protein